MSVVDTSAVLAILFQEEDAAHFARAIESIESPLISVASVVEASIVLCVRKSTAAEAELDELLSAGGFRIEPVTVEQSRFAREAFLAYGRGQHPAGLNFGDCFSYALAKATGETLLFKGADFRQTDIATAL